LCYFNSHGINLQASQGTVFVTGLKVKTESQNPGRCPDPQAFCKKLDQKAYLKAKTKKPRKKARFLMKF